MGSKQSKRSVDISGKEGEAAGGASEVAAAGGEGRVEPLADLDALKPQLNGDTPHIEPPEQISEKEKQLENGTPENEKDATTEKEAVVTNGANGDEQEKSEENGDAKPAAEAEPKKNKKEKVKKKWSLRSISFSRKEKPKQEKKHKEEENKTNGEADKLPEEVAESTVVADNKTTDDVKETSKPESKDEKTPETPITEPLTNGSSAPETPKEEVSTKEASPATSPIEVPAGKPTVNVEDQHNDLAKNVEPQEEKAAVETKAEEILAPASEEPAPTPDIPVATEVCVEKTPMIETTPPPLPSNPPPSSVTAFAETTMAPHLVEADLAKSPDEPTSPVVTTLSNVVETSNDKPDEVNILEKPNTVPTSDRDETNTTDVNDINETQCSNFGDKAEETSQLTNVESVISEVIVTGTDSSDMPKELNGTIEPISPTEKTHEPSNITDTQIAKTNGTLSNTESIEIVPAMNGDSEIKIEKTNGFSDESHTPVEESTELISEALKAPKKVITLPNETEDSVVSEEIEDMLPPPAAIQADDSGEENGGSNEEMSESFPLPPSELCPSESEVSGPASPEPAQESTFVIETKDEIRVHEISTHKIPVADAKEAASEAVAEAAGAGDGAPTD